MWATNDWIALTYSDEQGFSKQVHRLLPGRTTKPNSSKSSSEIIIKFSSFQVWSACIPITNTADDTQAWHYKSNRRQLKLKTYGILCEYVKPITLKLSKYCFSLLHWLIHKIMCRSPRCEKSNAQIFQQEAHGSCYTSVKQQTTKANKKNHRMLCEYVQALTKSSQKAC